MAGQDGAGKGATARAETKSKTTRIQFAGITFTVPAEMPFNVLKHFEGGSSASNTVGILREILGEEQLEKLWEAELGISQGYELVEKILAKYGVTPGE